MVHYKLTYYDARNLGEPARLILKYANVPFEDDRLIKGTGWPARKSEMPYGQVPVLWVDGKPLAQSYAIFRFLARKYGLAGNDDFESAKIDEIADFHKDIFNEHSQYLYRKLGFFPGDVTQYKEAFLESVNKNFPTYEKIIKESGSGFLSKSGISWIDFVVTNYLLSIQIQEPDVYDKYPELDAYVKRVHSIPQIKDYVENRKHSSF